MIEYEIGGFKTGERNMSTLTAEVKELPVVQVETIAPDGVGYGEGSIGVRNRLDNPTDSLELWIVKKTEQISQSKQAIVRVNRDYDTCSDGRCTDCLRLLQGDEVKDIQETSTVYKVFGGSPTMIVASDIALGIARPTVIEAFSGAVDKAGESDISLGAHSAAGATGEFSGCGAIDQAPIIIENVVTLEDNIRGTMGALFGPDTLEDPEYHELLDTVFARYKSYSATEEFKKQEYKGAEVVEMLTKCGTPIKVLKDQHREVRVVVNVDVEGYTTDQGMFRTQTGDIAQVFAWDVPRNQEIARKITGSDRDRKIALLSQIVYSLSTAATLTKGDLPVDIVHENSKYVAF